MQIHAVEQWLNEGWSPWRIGYGTVTLVATGVAVYGYVREPHHPGAVWWLLAGTGVIAIWALAEALRWRIKYQRLLAAQQADPSASPPRPIRELLAEGKGLQADVGSFCASWGADRPLPGALPGKIIRWEANVEKTLNHQPEIHTLLGNAPHVDASRPISGQTYGRIEYEIRVLESITSNGVGNSGITAGQEATAAAKVQIAIKSYRAEKIKKLGELCREGDKFKSILNSNENQGKVLVDIQQWETTALSVLSYWPDLWNRFSNARIINLFELPKIEEVRTAFEQELEILQVAVNRLKAGGI